ncbi:MAG: hypothetical protein ABFC28_01300 [Rikenellaceae bacterium]
MVYFPAIYWNKLYNVSYTITPSDNNLVVAIPKKVIEINPDVEQNERDSK